MNICHIWKSWEKQRRRKQMVRYVEIGIDVAWKLIVHEIAVRLEKGESLKAISEHMEKEETKFVDSV